LEDSLATLGWQALEPLVGLLQLLAARLRELVPALEVLQDPSSLVWRQVAEAPAVLTRGLAVFRRERTPAAVVFQDTLALLRRQPAPALQVTLDHGALVGRQLVEATGARLAPGDLQHAGRQDGRGPQRDGQPAQHQWGVSSAR